ncbi:MAG: hypothetical protein JO061_21970 [Acidobacteriaceae bacterium]|nr:hypothetical protein [Acidobacteriaceae bacterium]
MREFDEDWRYDTATREGSYVFSKGNPLGRPSAKETPVPFNMELAAGRVFISLYNVTSDGSYREKARALAQHFKDNLHLDPSGGYLWNYSTVSYSRSTIPPPPAAEDVGHSQTDVDFAVLAAQNGIVFTRSDLQPFVKSYFRFAASVQKVDDRVLLDLWMPLSWGSCTIFQAIYPPLISEPLQKVFLNALSEAALYADKCSSKTNQ